MFPSYVDRSINRINLLAIAILFHTDFVETHQSHHITNLHVFGSSQSCQVVHLIHTSTQGTIEIKIAPAVVVKTKHFKIVHPVSEVTIL
ncbi:hypothetical protein SDC9_90985 [bioreactor metagenome]|uniref:Uncharacterized protein n=1 Tax=bioreactor metagenome TaxID=1076179 RepID=A0A644ZU61_9ZZZZ